MQKTISMLIQNKYIRKILYLYVQKKIKKIITIFIYLFTKCIRCEVLQCIWLNYGTDNNRKLHVGTYYTIIDNERWFISFKSSFIIFIIL